jgi:DNA-binding PadR family transcriptional regulator
MAKGDLPGELEQLLLFAVMQARDDAYGLSVQQILRDAGRRVELPTIYTTLQRLEEKGWVSSELGGATDVRGGRAKRLFKVEGAGISALKTAEGVRKHLMNGLKPVLG